VSIVHIRDDYDEDLEDDDAAKKGQHQRAPTSSTSYWRPHRRRSVMTKPSPDHRETLPQIVNALVVPMPGRDEPLRAPLWLYSLAVAPE
jgi:hypothetical protein